MMLRPRSLRTIDSAPGRSPPASRSMVSRNSAILASINGRSRGNSVCWPDSRDSSAANCGSSVGSAATVRR